MIFDLKSKSLETLCNEDGFSPNDVNSICDLGASTKQDATKGYIGEKGIGFKSVFKIADKIWISSPPYSFKFDRHAPLGPITPIWDPFPAKVVAGNTQFYLQFGSENQASISKALHRNLSQLDPKLLLFLRQLKYLKIIVNGSSALPTHRYFTRTDHIRHGGEFITLTDTHTQPSERVQKTKFLVVRHPVSLEDLTTGERVLEPERAGVKRTELVLAFPVDEMNPVLSDQYAYAFLPMHKTKLKVRDVPFYVHLL